MAAAARRRMKKLFAISGKEMAEYEEACDRSVTDESVDLSSEHRFVPATTAATVMLPAHLN